MEIVSKGDRTLEKLDFYAAVDTKELLVIDRDPWQLSLYRRRDDAGMQRVAKSTLESDGSLDSEVVAARFTLLGSESCIRIEDLADPPSGGVTDIAIQIDSGNS